MGVTTRYCYLLGLVGLALSCPNQAEQKILGQDPASQSALEHHTVIETNGCIAIPHSSGKLELLTRYGKDRAPILSPNGRYVAFLRKSTNEAIIVVGSTEDYPGDAILADQIWLLDLEAGDERQLVQDRIFESDDITERLQKSINHIHDDHFAFSEDGKSIYFIASAWLNKGALHSVDVETGEEKFLGGANCFEDGGLPVDID